VDTPVNHSEYEQLAAGYVLGALEPDDEHLFQRHLGGCALCEANVHELEDVVGKLAYAVPPVQPPETLWASIRHEIRSEAAPAPAPVPGPVQAPAPSRAPRREARRRGSPLLARLAVAAAIVAVAALSVWNLNLRDQNAGYRDQVATLEDTTRLLTDPTTTKIALQGPATQQGAQATVLASADQDDGVLVVAGLPPAEAGKVWELWGIPEGQITRAEKALVFETSGGRDVQFLKFRVPVDQRTAFAVTQEPGPDGSVEPTDEPVMLGVPSGTA
jgi:anti-sigma-K factor RskA